MQDHKEILPPEKKKRMFTKVAFVTLMACVSLSAIAFFSVSARTFLKNSALSFVKAWDDTFDQGQFQDLSGEIDMEQGISASGTESLTQEASSSGERSEKETSGDAVSFAPEKKSPSAAKKESVGPVPVSDEGGNASGENNLNDASSDLASSVPEKENGSVKNDPSPSCSFPVSADPSRKIIFNEIAWMGSPSSSEKNPFDASKDEWMEIKNISGSDIDLSGWEVSNSSGRIKIFFSEGDRIAANGFFLLVRGASSSYSADQSGRKIYSGDLSNAGGTLAIMDPSCGVSDFFDASSGWPAGNNATKQTLERNADHFGWHTSLSPGGTPGLENSSGAVSSPEKSSLTADAQYKIIVAFGGDGPGSIVSVPAGMTCGSECTGTYASGTQITLEAVPGNNSLFEGWSGFCYGEPLCVFTASANVFLVATFHSTLPVPTENGPSAPTSSDPSGGTSSSPQGSLGHLVIAQVQIAGVSSTNDFVRIYNPTGNVIDLGGWKLRKKSQTGSEYSLRQFPQGSTVAVGKFFTWANAAGGFADMIGADVSSTETLSSDNSVAILDDDGTVIDRVAWGSGTDQYVEGSPYPTSSAPNQVLERKSVNGVMVDTDDNADDFFLR